MIQRSFRYFSGVLLIAVVIAARSVVAPSEPSPGFLSPSVLAASGDGSTLYIAEKTARQIAVFDIASITVTSAIPVPAEPTGLALSPDDETLYVTCTDPWGVLCSISTSKKNIAWKMKVGYGACSPVVRGDGKRLYICNRFDNNISVIDLEKREEISPVSVGREPIAAAITPDDTLLFVAHHLPNGPSDRDVVASSVRVIHTDGLQTVKEIPLPNGSTCLQDLCISNDGRFAFVTHILARFHMSTTQLDRGWMSTNAFTIIDVAAREVVNTILLDAIDRGAANPWGIACSPDHRFLCVTHAGTHEISLIDLPALFDKLEALSERGAAARKFNNDYLQVSSGVNNVSNGLRFLVGLCRRLHLEGNGPRDVVVMGNQAYVANYFSDNLNIVDIDPGRNAFVRPLPLGGSTQTSAARKGERLFHDGDLCFQGWQSCASCHPDGRADGLNWDLLNDGAGNPKNTKSLLLAHKTPPSMSTGVRANAEAAVRSGIHNILFMEPAEEDASAIDEYLKALAPLPSPHVERGKWSQAAKRGEKVFFSAEVGCAQCHSGPLYTDMQTYDVGTKGRLDRAGEFDTPGLNELWRTAPYLHDGRSATVRDMLTTDNRKDAHGRTSQLTEEEIVDLEAFLLCL